jgi:hypothetical protein
VEELKLLIQMVSDLPALAVWVLVAFYAYKVTIIGSIYGLMRFAIDRTHSWLVMRKTAAATEVDIRGTIEGMAITSDNSHHALIAQLDRIRGKGVGIDSHYIHRKSVDWLRAAIDAQEAKDVEAKP